MEKITDYRLSPDALVMAAGSSIDTQKKFYEHGQPFSASLERQALEAEIGLKLNYRALRDQLQKEPASGALDVLWIQLEKYESLLRNDH